jgi:hypothetical protein
MLDLCSGMPGVRGMRWSPYIDRLIDISVHSGQSLAHVLAGGQDRNALEDPQREQFLIAGHDRVCLPGRQSC